MKPLMEFLKTAKWTHVLAGIVSVSVVQAGTLWAMSQSYHLFFAAEEAKQKSFLERYGRPTQAQRMEAYTWMAPHYDQNVSQLEAGIADHFRKEVFADASGDVLEVAVGTGRIFKFLDASKVKRYVGVDLNEAMLEEARKKLPALTFDARVVRSDGHALPFSDASFDTVVGSLCLCAMEHPEKALQEMLRVCRPCGKVLLLEAGIAEKPIVRWGQRHLGVVPNPTHEWEFAYRDDNDVLGLLRACEGLKVDKEPAVRWAQRHSAGKFCHGDGRNLTWLPEETFDHVVSYASIYHLEKDEQCSVGIQLVRKLKIGGRAFLGWNHGPVMSNWEWLMCFEDSQNIAKTNGIAESGVKVDFDAVEDGYLFPPHTKVLEDKRSFLYQYPAYSIFLTRLA